MIVVEVVDLAASSWR